MAIAKHSFDICNGTLTISKVFEKNAAIPGSEEQKKMIEYMKLCGDRLIISYYKYLYIICIFNHIKPQAQYNIQITVCQYLFNLIMKNE